MSNCRSIVEAHHRSYFAEQGSPEEDSVPNPWLYLKLIPATDNVRPAPLALPLPCAQALSSCPFCLLALVAGCCSVSPLA